MSTTTDELGLFKYDTSTDGKQVFSIDTAMNDNWDTIDAFATAIKSLSNLSEEGEARFTEINSALEEKLEAEVLLDENGYIKFNNGLIIQWSTVTVTSTDTTCSFLISFPNQLFKVVLYDLVMSGSTVTAASSIINYSWNVGNSTVSSFMILTNNYNSLGALGYLAIGN